MIKIKESVKITKKQMIWTILNSVLLGIVCANLFGTEKLTTIDHIVSIALFLSIAVQYYFRYVALEQNNDEH